MVNWRKAGKKARDEKAKNEGLKNPLDKKKYYDVLNEYSKRKGFTKPTCFCCKYDDWKFLAFDHMSIKLKEEHKKLKGTQLAKRLERDDYPKQIQILCHNCNTGKEVFGGKHCPHHLTVKGQKKLRSVKLPLGKIF
ncbi:MAG: hypothetical protein O3C48_08485, partial [Crenarchaeota archaeon]|nr:hypothetical protein [Thermoproteota archaeon]